MSGKMEIMICVPPPHEQHVAQLCWVTEEATVPETQGATDIWGAITIENGIWELIIYPQNDSEPWRFPLNEVLNVMNEGKKKLSEFVADEVLNEIEDC